MGKRLFSWKIDYSHEIDIVLPRNDFQKEEWNTGTFHFMGEQNYRMTTYDFWYSVYFQDISIICAINCIKNKNFNSAHP